MKKKLIIALFILELILFTFSEKFPPIINGIILALTSLSIGLLPLIKDNWFENYSIRQDSHKSSKNFVYLFLVFVILYLVADLMFNNIISKNPTDPKFSDVIPSIQVLVERFVGNVSIYATPIPFEGYEVPPTYLPMQWGPFVIAHYLNIDFRAFAFLILLLGIIIYHINVLQGNFSKKINVLLISLPFITLFSLLYYSKVEFIHTVETMVVGFYFLLIASIFSKSTVFKSVALILCLLSRFSLLLWIPLYLFILFNENKKDSYKIIFLTGIGLFALYIIPYLSEDWGAFFRGYNYYTKAALSEWKGQDWQAVDADPIQLFKGVGLTSIFYKAYEFNIKLGLSILQKFHLIVSISTSLALGLYYYYIKYKKEYIIDVQLFLLLSFKIYLTIFYSFIQVPYKYLYFVPLFISIYIVFQIISGRKLRLT